MNKIFIFCENYNREFMPKLQLSLELLKEDGIESVYIGDQRLLYFLAKFNLIKNGLVLLKSAQKYVYKYLNKMQKYNILFLQDEEGLVSLESSKGKYNNRNDQKNLTLIDEIFCWNKNEKESFIQIDSDLLNKITISGNVRTCKKTNFINIYNKEIKNIKRKFKEYILIVGNGKVAFSNFHEPSIRKIIKTNAHKNGQNKLYLNSVLDWSENMIYSYFHLFDFLAKLSKDNELNSIPIIYRPHPGENKDLICKLFEGIENIYIEEEYSVTPWLFCAKAVISSGSTTLMESLNLKKPTFTIVHDADNKKYEKVKEMLPNKLSILSKDSEELLKELKNFDITKQNKSYKNIQDVCCSNLNTYDIYKEKVKKYISSSKTKSISLFNNDKLFKYILKIYDILTIIKSSKAYSVNHNKKFPENILIDEYKDIEELANSYNIKVKVINKRLIKLYK